MTTHTVNSAFFEPAIDADRALGRLQGSFLAIESPSDSEEEEGEGEEEDVHSVYEIESDRDEELEQNGISVVKYELRSKRRGPPVDSLSEKEDQTSSPPKRRRTAITQGRDHIRSKPIKVFVPPEIWLKIFFFSQPTFLARARRVSKAFKTLIDDEKVWRCARVYHFPEYPDPVLGLKEWEMWNLYLGVGCMICHAPKIKKRYWRFRIRCCVECLKQGTIKEYLLKERPGFRPHWIQYLVHGALDSWGNWTTPSAGPRTYFQKTFWLDDVKVLEMRMKPHQVAAKVLKAEVLQAEKDIKKIEEFEAKISKEKGKGADLICRQRYIDIKEKCSRVDPPFTDDVLCYIPAYQSAIRASRPLTDRSWKILLKKLEAGREAAEVKLVEIKRMRKEAELASNGIRAIFPMKSWIDHFLALNGGTVEKGCEASFALQALNYVRTRWSTRGEKSVPLSTVQLLWDEKLNKLLKKPGKIFLCAFCDKQHGLDAVFNHITMTHPQNMGWAEVSGDTPFNYWRNQIWPAELPILPFGRIFEGRKATAVGTSKPKQAPPKPRQVPPILNVPGPREILPMKLAPEQKAVRELHQAHMNEILSKIQAFKLVPDAHRFFLWFRLSIASYLREHNQIPNITIFALAADVIHQQRKEPMLRSLLKCGVCGAQQSTKRRPFIWFTLSNHFDTHLSVKDQPWTEKMLMLPSRGDIFDFCSKISDKGVKKQWAGMVKEADKELGERLDEAMRLEEEGVNFKNVPREKSGKDTIVQGKDVYRPGDLWQPIRPRLEGACSGDFGIGGDRVRELSRGRGAGTLRDQEPECGWGKGSSKDARGERKEAGRPENPQRNTRPETRGDRVSSRGSTDVRMRLNYGQETEPLRDPKRGFEMERDCEVEHDNKRPRVNHVSPISVHTNTVNYKNMPVPEFSSIPPQEIIKFSRTLRNPARHVEIPPKIQVTTLEAQVPGVATSGFDKSKENLEVCRVEQRSLSPSIDLDIEELFADA